MTRIRTYLRPAPILCLLLLAGVGGCASSLPPAERFATELLTLDRTKGGSISEDALAFDLSLIETMSDLELSRGGELVAVARIPIGIHPFRFYVFVERNRELSVQITEMNWGKVLYKGKWRVSREGLNEFLTLVDSHLLCSEDDKAGKSSSLVVHWNSSHPSICRSDYHPILNNAGVESAAFRRLDKLLEAGELQEEFSW